MKLAELMLEAGAQVGALDPVGVWRALRVPAVSGDQSFEVVVFGGLYGDLLLEPTPTAGELIADLVCDRGISFVLDVSPPSLALALLRSSGFTLTHERLPGRRPKTAILRAGS
jgi:hypothetical protein